MRSALCRLSYRAATRSPDQSELEHEPSLTPRRIAFVFRLRDDRKNLRHNFSPLLIADRRLPTSDCVLVIGDWQSTTANILGGPRGNRTHYLSIKSRALILMSFRPQQNWDCEFRIANFASRSEIKFAIRNSTFAILHAPAETRTRITH